MTLKKKTRRPNWNPTPAKGLVVDDDDLWAQRFAHYLDGRKVEPTVVGTLAEAETLLRREFFQVALVDMSLVGDENRDGLEVVRLIHQELQEGTQAILLTAFGGVEEGKKADKLGAFEVFSKGRHEGLDREGLLSTIDRAVEMADKTRASKEVGLELFGEFSPSKHPEFITTRMVFTLGEGYDVAEETIRVLLWDLQPVLIRKLGERVSCDEGSRSLFADLWSKKLGRRVGLFVAASQQSLIAEQHAFSRNPAEYRGGAYSEILREIALDVSGVEAIAEGPDAKESVTPESFTRRVLPGMLLVGHRTDREQFV